MSAVILNDGFNMLTGEDVKKRSSRSEGMVHHGAMDQGEIWSDVPLRRNLSLFQIQVSIRIQLPDAMTYTTSASNARIKKNSIMLQDVAGSLNMYS